MSPSHCDDMPTSAELTDIKRRLLVTMHEVMPSGDKTERQSRLHRLYYQALTLWHEAGKPLPFVAHLGPFVKLAPWHQEQANG